MNSKIKKIIIIILKQIKVVVDKALNEVTFLLMEVTLKVTKQPNLAE